MTMHYARIALTSLALVACSAGVSAQSIKPGLWEITSQMQGSKEMNDAMAEARKAIESMPPEQRKMMQDMMARQGVQMSPSGGSGMAIKICMTQEMIDRNEVASHKGDCTHTNSARSGNTMKFSFVCTQPPSSGEGTVTYNSPESYAVKMQTTSTVRGQAEKMEMQSSGRWLGGDCGNIKPISIPKK
ncbi:MAG: DUF3617 domain-containing protein [Rhodoferax sp.]